jgi:hypothetical protein
MQALQRFVATSATDLSPTAERARFLFAPQPLNRSLIEARDFLARQFTWMLARRLQNDAATQLVHFARW